MIILKATSLFDEYLIDIYMTYKITCLSPLKPTPSVGHPNTHGPNYTLDIQYKILNCEYIKDF
jgi:hypothetical protein